jgi:hypothetical protein
LVNDEPFNYRDLLIVLVHIDENFVGKWSSFSLENYTELLIVSIYTSIESPTEYVIGNSVNEPIDETNMLPTYIFVGNPLVIFTNEFDDRYWSASFYGPMSINHRYIRWYKNPEQIWHYVFENKKGERDYSQSLVVFQFPGIFPFFLRSQLPLLYLTVLLMKFFIYNYFIDKNYLLEKH